LPTDRIYATYFGGDEKAGLAPDEESKAIWERFLPKERVLPFGCKVRKLPALYSSIQLQNNIKFEGYYILPHQIHG
jgi:hypothetical protein